MNLTTVPPALMRAWARLLMSLPAPLLARLGGARARTSIDGQTLDVQLAVALALNDRFGPPPMEHGDPVTARQTLTRGFAPFDAPLRPMAALRDIAIDGGDDGPRRRIPARLYRPRQARDRGPAVLFYHGGGGVVGSIADYDALCRVIADDTGFVVLTVDYRMNRMNGSICAFGRFGANP